MRLLIIFLFLTSCGAQKALLTSSNYNKSDLKKIAEWKYGFDLEKNKFCELYILDGVPFDQNQIDSILSQYDKNQIGLITILDMSKKEVFPHLKCDLLTIINSKPQSNSDKRKILKEVKKVYNERVLEVIITDYQCADCPLLSVNDNLIWNPYERKKIVNELSLSKIENIVFINQPLNTKNFGATGKNGIVEITTE